MASPSYGRRRYSQDYDKRLHFGLGAAAEVLEVVVSWPGQTPVVVAEDVAADQTLVVRRGEAVEFSRAGLEERMF